jgi:hypothetical protein
VAPEARGVWAKLHKRSGAIKKEQDRNGREKKMWKKGHREKMDVHK